MQIYGPSHVHGAQPVHGPHATRAAQPSQSQTASPIGDELHLSDAAQLADRVAELPEMRADRVADIRAAILNGTYETADKLDVAVERLLDEIA